MKCYLLIDNAGNNTLDVVADTDFADESQRQLSNKQRQETHNPGLWVPDYIANAHHRARWCLPKVEL